MAVPVVALVTGGEQKAELAHLSRVIEVEPGVVRAEGGDLAQGLAVALAPDSFCEVDEAVTNETIPSEAAIALVLWNAATSGEGGCDKEKNSSDQEGRRHPAVIDI